MERLHNRGVKKGDFLERFHSFIGSEAAALK